MKERVTEKFSMFVTTLLMRVISIFVGSALLLTPHISVSAETTENLLELYGLYMDGPEQKDLELEMELLMKDINSMEAQKKIDEEYNAILQRYVERRENRLNKVLNKISSYQKDNDSIVSDIESNILTADINQLLKLDSSYKTNMSIMNDLLEGLNDFKAGYSYRDIVYDIDSKEIELTKVESEYSEVLDRYDLGDISDIQWIIPNNMYITSEYGYRIDPVNGNAIRFHSGTDFRAPEGTELKALFNGKVIACGWSDTAGNFITVQSGDNVKYFVCHLSEIFVKEGDKVKQYETIGLTGNTGSRTTGPHLHLALYLNGVTYDVSELFK